MMKSTSSFGKAQQGALAAPMNSCNTCLQPRKPVGDGSPCYGQHKQDCNALAGNGQQVPAGTMTRFGEVFTYDGSHPSAAPCASNTAEASLQTHSFETLRSATFEATVKIISRVCKVQVMLY